MIESIQLFIYEVISRTFLLGKARTKAVVDYICHAYCKESDWNYLFLWNEFWGAWECESRGLKMRKGIIFSQNCIIKLWKSVPWFIVQAKWQGNKKDNIFFLFYSQLSHIPIRNDWVRRNILGHKGLCLGNTCGEEPLQALEVMVL